MIQSRISNLRGESEKYRLGFRVILALVVFGSMIWGATANLSDQVMAPLFAIIAATGLAGTLGASAIGMREKILKGVIQLMAILASCFSATLWLLSAGGWTLDTMVGCRSGGVCCGGLVGECWGHGRRDSEARPLRLRGN